MFLLCLIPKHQIYTQGELCMSHLIIEYTFSTIHFITFEQCLVSLYCATFLADLKFTQGVPTNMHSTLKVELPTSASTRFPLILASTGPPQQSRHPSQLLRSRSSYFQHQFPTFSQLLWLPSQPLSQPPSRLFLLPGHNDQTCPQIPSSASSRQPSHAHEGGLAPSWQRDLLKE